MEDIVRVLRVIEYVGPRAKIEQQIARSINGPVNFGNGVIIRCATVGQYPEILADAQQNDRARAMSDGATEEAHGG